MKDSREESKTLSDVRSAGAFMFTWAYLSLSIVRKDTANLILLLLQLSEAALPISCIAITNCPLTRVQVNATIDWHRHLLRALMCKMSVSQLTSELGVPAS